MIFPEVLLVGMEDKEDEGRKSGLDGRGQRERPSDVSNDQEKVTLCLG